MRDGRGESEVEVDGGARPGLADVAASPTRRGLLFGAGAIGASAVLAACGGDQPSGPGTGGPGGNPGDGEQDDPLLASTGEVEVGGGLIVAAKGVVITQPTEGDFKGFSAACTHQGCFVSSVSNGLINCPCHGSQYSIEDGSVVRSAPELTPETQDPLPEVEITVDGDQILRA
jgi:Rieske Fe-S protein